MEMRRKRLIFFQRIPGTVQGKEKTYMEMKKKRLFVRLFVMLLVFFQGIPGTFLSWSKISYARLSGFQAATEYDGITTSEQKSNCVAFARYKIPSLPGGLYNLEGKKAIINSSTPKVGCAAIEVIRVNGVPNWNDTVGHVCYVESINGNQITTLDGGVDGVHIYRCTGTASDLGIIGYYDPGNTKTHTPVGCVDEISNPSVGKVHVSGWAYDPDDVSQSIPIHIYIGGAYVKTITANASRKDVDNVYHVGEFHGFDTVIDTSKTGNQKVDVYAINIGEGTGDNPNLEGSKTISINGDTIAPTISDITVTNVTKTGYTVTCKVSDNVGISKVEFPSWNVDIHNGGQAKWLQGTVSGNTATCRVETSSLLSGAIAGNYMTHIYAYDLAGNSTSKAIDIVYVYDKNIELVGDDNMRFEMGMSYSTDGLCTINGNSKDIVYESLNEDILTIDDGWINVKSPGTATIRASYKYDKTKYKDIACDIGALKLMDDGTINSNECRILKFDVYTNNAKGDCYLHVKTCVSNSSNEELIIESDYPAENKGRNWIYCIVDKNDFNNESGNYTTMAILYDENGNVIDECTTTYNFSDYKTPYHINVNLNEQFDVYKDAHATENEENTTWFNTGIGWWNKSNKKSGEIECLSYNTYKAVKAGRLYCSYHSPIFSSEVSIVIIDIVDPNKPAIEQPKTEQPKTEQPTSKQPKTEQQNNNQVTNTNEKNATSNDSVSNSEKKPLSTTIKGNAVTTEAPSKKTLSAPKITIKSVKNNKKKTVTIKWKSNSKVAGYQISYSKKKNFSGAKKKNLKSYYSSVSLKNLSKGKTYYVRIRAYVKDSKGNKVYGKWSSIKKVKIKK